MSLVYTLIPRPIGDFAHLDALTRYSFGLIWDRWKLSAKKENRDRFSDYFGIYCVFERSALAGEMGVTLPTIRRCIESLIAANLVYARRTGVGATYRYYISERAYMHMVEGPEGDLLPDIPDGEGLDPIRRTFFRPKETIPKLRTE